MSGDVAMDTVFDNVLPDRTLVTAEEYKIWCRLDQLLDEAPATLSNLFRHCQNPRYLLRRIDQRILAEAPLLEKGAVPYEVRQIVLIAAQGGWARLRMAFTWR